MEDFDQIKHKILSYNSPLDLDSEWEQLLLKKENQALKKQLQLRKLFLIIGVSLLLLIYGGIKIVEQWESMPTTEIYNSSSTKKQKEQKIEFNWLEKGNQKTKSNSDSETESKEKQNDKPAKETLPKITSLKEKDIVTNTTVQSNEKTRNKESKINSSPLSTKQTNNPNRVLTMPKQYEIVTNEKNNIPINGSFKIEQVNSQHVVDFIPSFRTKEPSGTKPDLETPSVTSANDNTSKLVIEQMANESTRATKTRTFETNNGEIQEDKITSTIPIRLPIDITEKINKEEIETSVDAATLLVEREDKATSKNSIEKSSNNEDHLETTKKTTRNIEPIEKLPLKASTLLSMSNTNKPLILKAEPASQVRISYNRNYALFELLGQGGFYSLNYGRIVRRGLRGETSAQIGISVNPKKFRGNQTGAIPLLLPFSLNQSIVVRPKHRLFTGIGLTLVNDRLIDEPNDFYFMGSLKLGYQYQNNKNRLFYKTEVLSSHAFGEMFQQDAKPLKITDSWFWIGIGIGIKF